MDELLNTAPCGFVSFGDDGTVLQVNATLASMLGYSRIELLGWHVDKLLPPGGRIFYHTYLFPMLKLQGALEEIYTALRTRDGGDVPVLLNGVRRERNGQMISDCVCVRMIQRHEYEDQLLEARRLAEESSAAKAKFLSMMSHDLRTPLTSIFGNAALLAAGVRGPMTPEQLDAVTTIKNAAQMQTTLISDILEFARLDSGRVQVQMDAVRVADAVARAEALVRVQAAEAGLRLTVERCDELCVLADANRLQQILLNLFSNAIKYTPSGGEIAVRCEQEGDRAFIRVHDTGPGIASEHLQRIFAPFVQLELPSVSASSRGVGLGLAISRELAQAMHGDVTVESSVGEGSTFSVELPAATA